MAHDQLGHPLTRCKSSFVFGAPLFWGAHCPYWAPRIRKAPASRTCGAAGTEGMLLQPPALSPCSLISLIPLFPSKEIFVPAQRTLTAVAARPRLEVGVRKPWVKPQPPSPILQEAQPQVTPAAVGGRGGHRGPGRQINILKVLLKVAFQWRIGPRFLASRNPAAGPTQHNASYFPLTNEFFLSAGCKQGEELSQAVGTGTAPRWSRVCWYKAVRRSVVCPAHRARVPQGQGLTQMPLSSRELWLGGSIQLLCAGHAVGMPCARAGTGGGTWGFASGVADGGGTWGLAWWFLLPSVLRDQAASRREMGTGRRCLHPPQRENRAESRFCERHPASCSPKLALDVWPLALSYEAPALLVLRGSLDAGEGSLMPMRCVAAPPIPS